MSKTQTGIDPLAVATEIRLGRMVRENVETKSRRYLIEGRVSIQLVTSTAIRALVRGTEEVHNVSWTERSGWHCTCPAIRRCSHVAALQLVVLTPVDGRIPPGGYAA